MTDWKAAGEKADAHRVVNLLRGPYKREEKAEQRDRTVAFLAHRKPTKVLDAWGGGSSADALVAAGLSVLSVDDGRSFVDCGVTRRRGMRAMTIAGQEGGYETAVGSLQSHAASCDAAFLDFIGFWSREVERTVRSCSHMKALVVTLMADRMAAGSLTPSSWMIAYQALLESHSGMRVRWRYRYRRASGLSAIVFALAPGGSRAIVCGLEGCDLPVIGGAKAMYCSARHKRRADYIRNADKKRSHARTRRLTDPRVKEQERARQETIGLLKRPPRRCRNCGVSFRPRMQPKAMYCPKPQCHDAMLRASWTKRNQQHSQELKERLAIPVPCRGCGELFIRPRGNTRYHDVRCRHRTHLRIWRRRKGLREAQVRLPAAA